MAHPIEKERPTLSIVRLVKWLAKSGIIHVYTE